MWLALSAPDHVHHEHARFQQLAVLDTACGELSSHRLEHDGGQVREFYRRFPPPVQVGVEATTGVYWLQALLRESGHELVVGDAARLRAMVVRRQKTDARDAEHLVTVLAEGRFPRVWVPGPELRDLRQLLLHRHRLVRMRTQLRNGLHALIRNHAPLCRRRRFTLAARASLAALPLGEFARLRREESLWLHDQLQASIEALDRRVEEQCGASELACRLTTHPGVGPVTALTWVCIIGDAARFATSAQVCSYLGADPVGTIHQGPAAAGEHQQARQQISAFSAGGGGADGGEGGCAVGTDIPALGRAPQSPHGQGGSRPPAGGTAVLDVASECGLLRLARGASTCGLARGYPWPIHGRQPDWASASRGSRAGSSHWKSWPAVEGRIDGWWPCHRTT